MDEVCKQTKELFLNIGPPKIADEPQVKGLVELAGWRGVGLLAHGADAGHVRRLRVLSLWLLALALEPF